MAGHNDLAHAMQAETSVQAVYEAGLVALQLPKSSFFSQSGL